MRSDKGLRRAYARLEFTDGTWTPICNVYVDDRDGAVFIPETSKTLRGSGVKPVCSVYVDGRWMYLLNYRIPVADRRNDS